MIINYEEYKKELIEYLKVKIDKNQKEIINIDKKLKRKIKLQEENSKLLDYIDIIENKLKSD